MPNRSTGLLKRTGAVALLVLADCTAEVGGPEPYPDGSMPWQRPIFGDDGGGAPYDCEDQVREEVGDDGVVRRFTDCSRATDEDPFDRAYFVDFHRERACCEVWGCRGCCPDDSEEEGWESCDGGSCLTTCQRCGGMRICETQFFPR